MCICETASKSRVLYILMAEQTIIFACFKALMSRLLLLLPLLLLLIIHSPYRQRGRSSHGRKCDDPSVAQMGRRRVRWIPIMARGGSSLKDHHSLSVPFESPDIIESQIKLSISNINNMVTRWTIAGTNQLVIHANISQKSNAHTNKHKQHQPKAGTCFSFERNDKIKLNLPN